MKTNSLIGNLVRDIRIIRKLKQSDLAGLAGISKSCLSEIENGLKTPKTQQIEAICNVLKVPLWTLFYMAKGEKNPKTISLKKLQSELEESIKSIHDLFENLNNSEKQKSKREKTMPITGIRTFEQIYQDRKRIKDTIGKKNKIPKQ